MKNEDVQLIQRVLRGEDDAFSLLVGKYQKQVHALAWRKIGDFHIAEEITQDTFLKAYKRLATLKEPQRFVSWLYVIAANLCSSWLRKKRLRTHSLEHLEQEDKDQLEKGAYSEFVVKENERISGQTQRHVVKKLLAKLPESERTIITLHYFGEMSCTEISAFLGVSANTIKSRLRRAQQRLKMEEPIIREALDNFQISPNLTENVMREISRIKPAAPSGGKPFVPWAVAASTLTVILLMFGFGNHQYLTRFQQPYSFDATTEMTVEIVDAPIVANLESKPDVRKQIGSVNALDKRNHPQQQPNDAPTAIAEAQGDEIVTDYTQWELPEKAKARLGKGWINAIQFSPDGTQLAVGSGIGVWLYDVNTGKEISLFPGICRALAFSPDGRFLVNGGDDATTLWEVATGRKVTRHNSLPAASVLWFSEDNKTLVILNESGDTICWIDTDTEKRNVKKIENRFGSQSHTRVVYALTHGKVAIAEDSGILQLWNAKSGKKVFTLTGPAERLQAEGIGGAEFNRIISLAFSPDGTRLASGRLDRTVRLWDTAGNNEPILLQKQSLSPALLRSTQEFVDGPNVLLFSPDGKILACGEGQNVKLWDITTAELITTFRGHIGLVDYLTFSPDGSILASASEDGTVLYWNINTEDQLPPKITEHTHEVEAISFMKGSSTLASVAHSGIITLWDLETSQRTTHRTKTAFENTRYSLESIPLAFSPDGTKLASKGILNTPTEPLGTTPQIRLIDVTTGRELTNLTYSNEGVTPHLTFSPDGKTVVFSAHGHTYGKIRLWNIETDKILDIRFSDKAAWINAAAFSPDGNKFVAGTSDGKVQMWDAKTGVHLTSFFDKKPPKSGALMNLTFSSDGSLLAVMYMKQIHLLGSPKIPHFKVVFSEPDLFWDGLVFSPDNTVLILSLIDGGIQLRDVTTGKVLNTLDGHTCSPETFSFSPDGKTLVSAGGDGTILLWDWEEVLNGAEL